MRVSFNQFQIETGASDGEMRLLRRSPAAEVRNGQLDKERSRVVLSGIRLARQAARLEVAFEQS